MPVQSGSPRATRSWFLLLPLILVLCLAANRPGTAATVDPDDKTITDAYVYLLGRVLVIRQEHMDRAGEGFAYNRMKYNPLGSADFANPNFDVAYLEAWIAADERTPVVLEVPRIDGRYYTAQILDEWAEVITDINERTFPTKPYGKFAFVAPGWKGELPADVTRIDLHSRKAKLLGRVELKGDPSGAVALQKAFRLAPLGNPVIEPPTSFVTTFGQDAMPGVEIFDNVDPKLYSAPDLSFVAAQMQQQVHAVAAYAASTPQARTRVDKVIREQSLPAFLKYTFTEASPYRNHWLVANAGGHFGENYWGRTAANYAGIWTNLPSEVVYSVATTDGDGQTLNGSNSYIIHFAKDDLPSSVVNSYWSIILVDVPGYRVVPNPLKRYNFNTYSSLKSEPDGSLKIGIGSRPVAGVPESNWLPAPAGKPFSLTFRTYVPKEVVIAGKWAPPPVTKLK